MTLDRPKRILIICTDTVVGPLLAQVVQIHDFLVHLTHSPLEGTLRVAEGAYDLVLVDLGDSESTEEAIRLCDEIKAIRPEQMVAFRAGQWRYVPADSCPDEVIQKEQGAEELLSRISELTA